MFLIEPGKLSQIDVVERIPGSPGMKTILWLGVVVHIYNPSTQKAEARESQI
jgi:hypothetical protein